jgi:branched-chain amino acid aminotransferase
MSATVNVNGKLSDQRRAVVSVFDHGFLYGEGVYETLRTYNRRPFLLDRHLRRLHKSAGMIALGVPLTDDQLADRVTETVDYAARTAPRDTEWYIRILLTRGVGDLTYDTAATPAPTVVIIVKPHVDPPLELYANGVRVIISSIVRNHPGTVNPMIKSNNLLNCALAMQEGFSRGAYEALMRNYKGELAEGSFSNLFIVKGGVALTPPLSVGLLPGITREFMWDVGQAAAITVSEAVIHDSDVYDADEVFLTGTTNEVMPIVHVEDRRIGPGVPGPVTKALHETFRKLVAAKVSSQ